MKRRFIFPLLVAVAMVAPVGAVDLKVGVYLQPPYTVFSKSDTVPQGLLIDVLESMAARNGWTLTYVMDSRAGILNKMWRKELDLMVPAPRPMERSDLLDYASNAILSSHGQIFTRSPLAVPSLDQLSGKTVAVLRGDIHYAQFLEGLKTASIACQFVEMQRYEDVFEAVRSGRVDAGLVDSFAGASLNLEYGLAATPLTTAPVNLYLATSHNGNRNLLLEIDQTYQAEASDGAAPYQRFLSSWITYHPPVSSAMITVLVVGSLLGGGLIIMLCVYQVRLLLRRQTRKQAATHRQLITSANESFRRETEAEQRKRWYRTLLNTTPDPVLVHAVDEAGRPGKFIEANNTACRRLGYSREEFAALTLNKIEINPEVGVAPRYAALLSRWRDSRLPDAPSHDPFNESITAELQLRTKDGKEIPAEVSIRIIDHDGQPAVVYTVHDITTRRKVQNALKESERRFSDFFTRSPIGVALYTPERKLTDVNQAALAMFGFSERSQFSDTRLLDSGELNEESFATLLKGGTVRFELALDFDDAKKAQRFNSSRAGRCHFDILITNLGLDANFNPKGYMLQIQDITERRRAEEALHQQERLLRQAQKMEAIGTLAGGIAHDFNNILTPIIGYTEMAMLSPIADDTIRSNLDEVLKASHRAKDLVRQILTFSRQSEQEIKPLRLIPLVGEVTKLLKGSILSTIELRTSVTAERDIVKADATQLHQVIMNLSTNAIHAMRDKGGILEIALNPVQIDSRTRGTLARLRHGTYIEIVVRDTGHGMERSIMERIFEPFFTTKQSGEGTGMGLGVVHGIVTSLQGGITVESEIGKGSAFHVVLPVIDPPKEIVSNLTNPLPQGSERILFVDDELGIITMVKQMLSSLGYQVTTATRAFDALTILRQDPSSVDLVITDQIMPGMTGLDMVREMHSIRTDLPVILCTGFSKTISEQDLRTGNIRQVLMKPIVLRQMAEAIRTILDQPSVVPTTSTPTAPP